MSPRELFCSVDELWARCELAWREELLTNGQRQRQGRGELHPSERMTLLIWFPHAHYPTCKALDTAHVQRHLRHEFPTLVSALKTTACLLPSRRVTPMRRWWVRMEPPCSNRSTWPTSCPGCPPYLPCRSCARCGSNTTAASRSRCGERAAMARHRRAARARRPLGIAL